MCSISIHEHKLFFLDAKQKKTKCICIFRLGYFYTKCIKVRISFILFYYHILFTSSKSMEFLMSVTRGGSGADPKNSCIDMLLGAKHLAWRHNSWSGVLRISGHWKLSMFLNLNLLYSLKTIPGWQRPALPLRWIPLAFEIHTGVSSVIFDAEL